MSDAKRYFSKNGCAAYGIGHNYLSGSAIRQDYLETAISWINKGNIEDYMSKNQHKPNTNELWLYFKSVINWITVIFPKYRKEMKGVAFGVLYNEFKQKEYDSKKLEEEITKLMLDDDVTKKSGIYSYVLTRQEKYLSIRTFSDNQKREAYEKQKGVCVKCEEHFELEEMEADHIKPWQLGLKTTYYLRSLSITQIDKTVEINTQTKAEEPIESFTTKDAVASAIDKSTCEVCQ